MRNLIKKILKEEQEWFDEIKPMEVYLPWLERGIEGLEKWKGDAYHEDDEIGESITQLKKFPTKENVRYTISTILRWKGQAYQEGDDFDWSLDELKMSIDPYSWKRFNIHLNGGKGEMKLIFTEPNLDKEWDEAIRYPEFEDMGKEKWIELASSGEEVFYNDIENVLDNVDLNFDELDNNKQARFNTAFKNGKIETPIAVKFENNTYDLVAGNTRVAGLVKNGVTKFPIWVINIDEK